MESCNHEGPDRQHTTDDGIEILGTNGRRIVQRTGAPTEDACVRGDKVVHNAPSVYGPSGYWCVSTGTSGTWYPDRILDVTALVGSTTWDPASVADGARTSTTVTVTGVLARDMVCAGLSSGSFLPAGAFLTTTVTAADTVTVMLHRFCGGAVDRPSSAARVLALCAAT